MKTGNTSDEVSAKGFHDTKTVPSTTREKKSLTGRKVAMPTTESLSPDKRCPINQSDTARYTKGRYRYCRHCHCASFLTALPRSLTGRRKAALVSRQMATCGLLSYRKATRGAVHSMITRWLPKKPKILTND